MDMDMDADVDADVDIEGLSGNVVWEDGSGAEGAQVRLCLGGCAPSSADEDGYWVFEVQETGTHAWHAPKLGDASYAVPFVPLNLSAGEVRSLGPITIPRYTATADTAGVVELDGLTVDFDPDALKKGGYAFDKTPFIGATRMDPAGDVIPFDGVEGTVVGLWYLGNYDFSADPAFDISIDATLLGLSDGDTVTILNTNIYEYGWDETGTATVADGQIAVSGGLHYLSSLLVVTE
jgi:hypothetical protein